MHALQYWLDTVYSGILLDEQYTTVDKYSVVGHFGLNVFVKLLTFGSKRPTIEYSSTVVYCSSSENFAISMDTTVNLYSSIPLIVSNFLHHGHVHTPIIGENGNVYVQATYRQYSIAFLCIFACSRLFSLAYGEV